MRYVIIGNSVAAVGAVEGIREIDHQGEIVVISNERYDVYSKPLISYYLAGKIKEEQMNYRKSDFYEKNRIIKYLAQEKVHLFTHNKTLEIEPANQKIGYDRLLIATGGKPVMPSFIKKDYTNVFFFHSWDDVKKINTRLKSRQSKEVIVLGGGLIGLKAAESLLLRGQKVTVVESGNYILNSILDNTAAQILEEHLSNRGISFLTAVTIDEVYGEQSIRKIRLNNGSELECDMLVLAAGIRPNCEWLSDGEIKADNGILVDEYLQTSAVDIYAAGDVARAYDLVSGENKVIPILPNAYLQGKIAGFNMAGKTTQYKGGMAFNSIPLLGLNVAAAGINVNDDDYEFIIERNDNFSYRKLIIKDDVLQGFIMVGNIYRCGIYRYLIEQRIDLKNIKKRLLSPGFGWIDLLEYRFEDGG